jgi:opacity protein-like surface antigen
MSFRRTLAGGLLLVALTPASARADGLIIPQVGVNFGGDSGNELSEAIDASRLNWGASFAWMGGGVFGVEADFGFSPDFFGKTDLGGSGVLSVMGNLLLGIPFGGQQGFGVRPYGIVGAGLIRPSVDAFGDVLEFDENKAAFDFGGGVMIFFATHFGVRADLRYFRSFDALDITDLPIPDRPGELDFTRFSIGAVFRF